MFSRRRISLIVLVLVLLLQGCASYDEGVCGGGGPIYSDGKEQRPENRGSANISYY